MKTYNRAIDYTVLALNELRQGNPVLAARLLAKAGEQKDLTAAINVLEASNKFAYANQVKAAASSKARLKATSEEFPFGEHELESAEEEMKEEVDFESDPLEQVAEAAAEEEMEEETEEEMEPAEAMAAVLSKMKRRASK
jgi:hypothetical protein